MHPARLFGLITACLALLLALSAVHLSQGTSELGLTEVLALLSGQESAAAAVVLDSRLPRLLAGLSVGIALGVAGGILQSVTRNSLASPDTLAVNAGAYFVLTLVASLGITLPFLSGAAVAFGGGLLAAALVIAISTGPGSSPVRMVLAGSVIALGLAALTSILLLFFPWQTQGLFAWGAGSLNQAGLRGVVSLLPVLALACVALALFGGRLDVLQLGEDAAAGLGVKVRMWQAVFVILAVLCAATAVTVAGPIGFVGLCAPALARLAMKFVPELSRQQLLIAVSALFGALLVIGADVLMRAAFGAIEGVTIPTGVVTSLIGAVFLVVLAQTARAGFDSDSLVTMRAGTRLGLRFPWPLITGTSLVLIALAAVSMLLGDTLLLGGDVFNWLQGIASARIDIVLDARVPRIAVAMLGGACLALAGSILQGVTRNPLADPSVLGISGAAATGAVVVLVVVRSSDLWAVLMGAFIASAIVGVLLFGLSVRGGLDHARMVLAGIGIAAASTAVTTVLLVRTDPWNQTMALTWLAGSTYGATFVQCVPMIVALLATTWVLTLFARDLDVIQIDELTPQILGIRVSRTRIVLVSAALVLTAAATISIGTIAFIGLVAPHAARILIGRNHARLFTLAALFGALLVTVADTFGRTVIAPAQIPAGLVTAVLGCPYFVWLLWRMRRP